MANYYYESNLKIVHAFFFLSYSVVMSKFIVLAICFIFPSNIKAVI